jgi:predicted ATPase
MAAGLSQEALAERARISTEAVGALERGSRKAPQRQTLALLIDALKVEGADRERLELAAVRPSTPRRREAAPNLSGVVSPLRLPAPLTSFVGRELDLRALEEALSIARLVSVVGPGGVGKSRLALEAARRLGGRFDDGAVLVELAPIAIGASVIPAFASVLGVADAGDMPLLDRVARACGDARQLIVADNCEHVLDTCAELVFALLRACPNVRIIATSREPLRASGEHVFRLGPLAPDSALELFVDRAKAAAPYRHFESRDMYVAGEICRRVDGIPLAIELAASRTDMFDVETIHQRLRERFELLSAASRTTLPQHRTLRALVDWSHELLEPLEARTFRRLGLFAGGCRLDDAEQILAFDGVASDLVWEALARLHDKSLIEVDRADPPRFSMLQTIHDYARERLDDSRDMTDLASRYATHYYELAIAAGPVLRTARQGEAIDRLSADVDNIRASLALSLANPALRELGLRALGPLALYWMHTGGLTEGVTQIQSLVSDVREPSIGVASACAGAAFLEFNRGRFSEGSAHAERAYEAAVACGDEWLTIYSSTAVCAARSARGERPEAAATSTYERAKGFGDQWLIAGAAFELGWEAVKRDDRQRAARFFSEALELARATGDRFLVYTAAQHLGQTVTETDPALAARLFGEAIECTAPSSLLGLASCIESLVTLALALKRVDDAARLVTIASAFRLNGGDQPPNALIEAVRRAKPSAELDRQLDERGNTALVDANDVIHGFLEAVT